MSKESKLLILKQNGYNIPKFIFVRKLNYNLPFKSNKYIVRSSFNIEDSKNSFAGIFNSYGPIKEHEIKPNLQKIFNNITNAVMYNNKIKLNKKIIPGAIIQEYVESKIGGVCFTNHESMIIIESSKKPEIVTSGGKIDHTYRISRFSLCTKDLPKTIIEVIADSLDIESLFGKPQDIEWLENDQIYILQTREAKITDENKINSVKEFLDIIPPSIWDRYLAFSFIYNEDFKKVAYDLVQDILRLNLFDWNMILSKSFRKPKGKNKIEKFKDAVLNYGYYGLLNQITEDNSLAMKRVELSCSRLGMSQDILLDYAINKKSSIYSKIVKNPKRYEETFIEEVKIEGVKEKTTKPKLYKFSKRQKKLADFFALLYDIKCYGVFYHDYNISPILKKAYDNLPDQIKNSKVDYISILEKQGFSLPKIERTNQKLIPNYKLSKNILGKVGKSILVYKDVTPEAVLKLKNVKCIISENGGLLSHASILAREFGISFIAGLKDAEKLFEKGDELQIKLIRGKVFINNNTKNNLIKVE